MPPIGLRACPDDPGQCVSGWKAIDALKTHAQATTHRFTLVAHQAHSGGRFVSDKRIETTLISSNARVGAVLRDPENTFSLFSPGGKFTVQFVRIRVFAYGDQIPKQIAALDPARRMIIRLLFEALGCAVRISRLHVPLKSKRRASLCWASANFISICI